MIHDTFIRKHLVRKDGKPLSAQLVEKIDDMCGISFLLCMEGEVVAINRLKTYSESSTKYAIRGDMV